jgi:hypothetical protein
MKRLNTEGERVIGWEGYDGLESDVLANPSADCVCVLDDGGGVVVENHGWGVDDV